MKKTILSAIALLTVAAAYGEVYNYLTIKQDDKTISIPLSQVQEVCFTTDDQSTEMPGGEGYTLRVLTFEDADYLGSGNYLGQKNWSSLIDSRQYGGPLLYGDYDGTPYYWFDENNTNLFAAIDLYEQGLIYWNGGEAISNYVNPSYATESVDHQSQLSTPTGGHGGSKNFCVHNGYFDGVFYNEPQGGIWFDDGEARVIDHMYVSLTSYGLSVGMLGNRFTDPAGPSDWVKLVAIGTDADGNTRQTQITMCEGGRFVTEWVKWDLSCLGEIIRLDFNVTSSMTGEYGMNFPAYFAYDDIAVRFPTLQ